MRKFASLGSCSFGVLLFLLMGLSGCSDMIRAHGRVVKDGKPAYVRGRTLMVTFYAMDVPGIEEGDAFPANQGANGTFTVPGKRGKGIPPGKYRITVELMSASDSDYLKGEFGREKSPIVRQVASSDEIVIDLENPNG